MSDQVVGVTNETPGAGVAEVDTSQLTVGANTVQRQRIVLADPTQATRFVLVNADGSLNTASSVVTPASGTNNAIATGGTAVTLVTGPCKGGYITNPPTSASQGIGGAENAYVDPVGVPGSTDAAGNGTTTILTPGQSYTIPPLGSGSLIKGNAATNGHKLTVVTW